MKLTLASEFRGIGKVVLYVEGLLFLLPDTVRIGHGYWAGVGRRLSSGRYWVFALACGIGAAVLMAGLLVLAQNLARFSGPPAERKGSGSQKPK